MAFRDLASTESYLQTVDDFQSQYFQVWGRVVQDAPITYLRRA